MHHIVLRMLYKFMLLLSTASFIMYLFRPREHGVPTFELPNNLQIKMAANEAPAQQASYVVVNLTQKQGDKYNNN